MATRHNLCTNPALGVNVTGWGGGSTPTRASVTGFGRSFGAHYTSGTFLSTAATLTNAVTAGLTYTASLYMRPASFNGSGIIYIEWINSSGGGFGYPTAAYSLTASTVSRASITAVAPSGAVAARIVCDGINYAANAVDATMVLIEQVAALGTYFDGDTASASWDGTVGLSASTLADALGPTATDSVGLADAATLAATRPVAATDSAGITDALTALVTRTVTTNDSAGLADAATLGMQRAAQATDTAGLVDALTTTVTRTITVNDLAGLSDTLTVPLTINRTISDPAGLADVASTSATVSLAFADGAGISDLLVTAGSLTPQFDDPAGLADAVALAVTRSLTIGDVTGLSDVASSALTRFVVLDDLAGLADAATLVGTTPGQTFSDSVGLSDVVAFQLTFAVTVVDAVGLADAVSGLPSAGANRGAMFDRVRRAAGTAGASRPAPSMGPSQRGSAGMSGSSTGGS